MNQSENEIRVRVARRLADMVSLHLFGEGGQLCRCLLEELSERTGYHANVVQNRLIDVPFWEDVPAMVQAAGLQLGISIRSPGGKEVTFYPELNFDRRPEPSLSAKAKPQAAHQREGHSQR